MKRLSQNANSLQHSGSEQTTNGQTEVGLVGNGSASVGRRWCRGSGSSGGLGLVIADLADS